MGGRRGKLVLEIRRFGFQIPPAFARTFQQRFSRPSTLSRHLTDTAETFTGRFEASGSSRVPVEGPSSASRRFDQTRQPAFDLAS